MQRRVVLQSYSMNQDAVKNKDKRYSVDWRQTSFSSSVALALGAFRQIGAEGSVVLENGHDFLPETPTFLKWAILTWRAIELETHSNPEKFPDGFHSYDVTEEIIEGAGMSVPGVFIARMFDRALLTPILEKTCKDQFKTQMIVRAIVYSVFAQSGYQFLAQNLGPLIHRATGTGDVEMSFETLIQVFEYLSKIVTK